MLRTLFLFLFILSFFSGFSQNSPKVSEGNLEKTTKISLEELSSNPIVSNVKILGTKRTKISFIKKMIIVKPGMVIKAAEIEEDINRLKRLPSISHAYFEIFSAKKKGEYNVHYTIVENFTLIPFANLYTSTNDEFAFRVGLEEFNFLGRNMTLGGFYQYDVFSSYGVSFWAPNLFSKKLGISLSYTNLTTQEPVFIPNTAGDTQFKYNNESIEVLGLYEFNFKNKIDLGVSFFTENYNYLFGAITDDVPPELSVNKYLFKLIYKYDNVKYDYQYLSGFRSSLNLQYVHSLDQGNLPEFVIGFNDFNG